MVYAKSFKWIIIEIPRNIFYHKYALVFLHFGHTIKNPIFKKILDRPTATRTGKGKPKDDSNFPSSTGAWPCEVGVCRVVWNNGNGLASSEFVGCWYCVRSLSG